MLENFLNPSYWFTFTPPSVGGTSGNVIFGSFLLVFIFGIVIKIVANHRMDDRYLKEVAAKITTLLVTMGLIGIGLYFMSFERIRFFGARFWYPLWLLATLVWAYYIARYIKRDLPATREKAIERKEKAKYFPSRRK